MLKKSEGLLNIVVCNPGKSGGASGGASGGDKAAPIKKDEKPSESAVSVLLIGRFSPSSSRFVSWWMLLLLSLQTTQPKALTGCDLNQSFSSVLGVCVCVCVLDVHALVDR